MYFFKLLVDGIISETDKICLMLSCIPVLSQKILDLGLLDNPTGEYLLFFFLLNDDIGCIDFFFFEFAALYFLDSFDCGFFFIA